jgi:energy-coupling factor transporter ATP-binding protein EcfA2
MFHAAGIQDPQSGNTVALVGHGGAGKTTLVRTLCQGRGYITDETVAVDADNTVLPYPKPVSVRRELSSPWKNETDPHELGLLAPVGSPTLAAVALLDRRDDHDGAPMIEQVATLDAIAALTPETSHLPELEKPLQRMASLCDAVGVVRVTYRDAEQLAPLVDEWLRAST